MGLLCDLFVNTREEALAYDAATAADRDATMARFSPAQFGGLTSLEFGTLWAILQNEAWDARKHMLLDIAFGEDNESWLHQFQDNYVSTLSKLDATAIDAAADGWSRTEEIASSADDVRPVIEALVRLSKEAISRDLGLYMWGSL
jgi:hypothetical protein